MMTPIQLFVISRVNATMPRSQPYLAGQLSGMECASIDRAIVTMLAPHEIGTAEFDAWWAGFHAGHTEYLMARSESVQSAVVPTPPHSIHSKRNIT